MADTKRPQLNYKTGIVVIGAGQAGLSAAYHLKQLGFSLGRDFVVLDGSPHPGGAWQFRWPSLTLSIVNRVHDLPGLPFSATVPDTRASEVHANVAVPRYFQAYEKAHGLSVYRPVTVKVVCERHGRLRVETDKGQFSAQGIINATGTWDTPYIPEYPGASLFQGEQLHTRDYQTATYFEGSTCLSWGAGYPPSSYWMRSRA